MTNWILLRAAGIGAYLMLFLAVTWGLAATTVPLGKRVSKPSATLVHQFLSTCGLTLVGLHVALLLIDRFLPFAPADVLVLMHTTYRPVAVAFGVVAMYALVFVIVLSWLRRRIGTRWWRRSHLLAVPTFTLSLVHGVFAGSDTVRPWMWTMYLATGAITLFLVIARGLSAGYRPQRVPRPAHAPGAGQAVSVEPASVPEPAATS
jgi:predicted ferric reductase